MAKVTFFGYKRAMGGLRPLRVQLLAFQDCTAIVPVGLFDLLRKSIELSQVGPDDASRRRVDLSLIAVGRGRKVTAAGGLELSCDGALADTAPGDAVVVPALDPDVMHSLERNQQVVPWLRQAHHAGSDVLSACTGAFALAEAGLLDGRRATTHWAFQQDLQQRYPRVKVEHQAILVDQGRIVTAGGATSFINLAHFLVERLLGQGIARAASQMFLIDANKAPQGAYAVFSSQKRHGDEAVLRAQELIEASPAGVPAMDQLAHAVALSRRTFARRFLAATGNTPREYVQRVRMEAAKRALEDGKSVAETAERVGYGDPVAFRKIFVQVVGLTPAEYRARYGPRHHPAWQS
ncbi:MAG: helix-turn-helix domain-containing protein [Polyangiaceae bacterium]